MWGFVVGWSGGRDGGALKNGYERHRSRCRWEERQRRRCGVVVLRCSVIGGGGSKAAGLGEDLWASLDRNWGRLSEEDDEEEEEEDFDAAAEGGDEDNGIADELPADPAELIAESGLHFDTDGTPEWYFLQARAGMEDRVRASVEGMVRSLPSMRRKVADVIVPKTQTMKLSSTGKTVKKDDRMFPGYLLIYMVMDYPTWREINNIAYVQGFVGDTNQKDFKGPFQKPLPVAMTEIRKIFQRLEEHANPNLSVKSKFLPGQRVHITEGSFANRDGRVVKVVPDEELATVSVIVLDRVTQVEVFFSQMEVAEPSEDDGEDGDELDEVFGKMRGRSDVNLKKRRSRNREFKKGDQVVVKKGPYGGCTGTVKMMLPRQGKILASVKMFSRSLDVKLDYDLVRFENEDDVGELLEEETEPGGFVTTEGSAEGAFAELDDDEESADFEADLDDGDEEAPEEGIDDLLRQMEETPSVRKELDDEDETSDEEFLRQIDKTFAVQRKIQGEAKKEKRSRDGLPAFADRRTWFKGTDEAAEAEEAFAEVYHRQTLRNHSPKSATEAADSEDLVSALSLGRDDSDEFVEDEITEDDGSESDFDVEADDDEDLDILSNEISDIGNDDEDEDESLTESPQMSWEDAERLHGDIDIEESDDVEEEDDDGDDEEEEDDNFLYGEVVEKEDDDEEEEEDSFLYGEVGEEEEEEEEDDDDDEEAFLLFGEDAEEEEDDEEDEEGSSFLRNNIDESLFADDSDEETGDGGQIGDKEPDFRGLKQLFDLYDAQDKVVSAKGSHEPDEVDSEDAERLAFEDEDEGLDDEQDFSPLDDDDGTDIRAMEMFRSLVDTAFEGEEAKAVQNAGSRTAKAGGKKDAATKRKTKTKQADDVESNSATLDWLLMAGEEDFVKEEPETKTRTEDSFV